MLKLRLTALLVAAATSISLLLGAAMPAQAVEKPSAPTTSRPRCEGILGINCRVPASYDEIKRLTKKALATNNPNRRVGIIRYELLTLFGNVAMWGDRDKIVPVKVPRTREALDAILTNIPAPSNAVVRCYGNWMMNHVATRGANNATIQNFYSLVTAIKTGRDAYGKIRAKAKSEQKYIDALSQPRKVLRMLANDRTKELIKKTYGVDVDAAPAAPADMADGYIQMILDSRKAVTQAQYSGSVEQLFQNIMGNGDVRYTGCQNIPAPPKYVTKTITQVVRGSDLFATLNGSLNSYDSKQRGYCNPVGSQLQCAAYDSGNNPIGGEQNSLRVNFSFNMPDEIRASAAEGSAISVQVQSSIPALSGSVDWQYGRYASDPQAQMILNSGAQDAILGGDPFTGVRSLNMDYFMRENTSLTLASVTLTYTYTAKI